MEHEEFLLLLRSTRQARDDELAERFERSLPFGDAMFDRWERAKRLGFATGASIYDSAHVFGNVEVGKNTWVGPCTLLDGSGGGVRIGAYCTIGAGVHIYTHDTALWALSGGQLPRRTGPVLVGDCCYIGAQSILVAGVTVGRQVVIAANSVVNRDVPERTIVGGSPARKLGRVSGEGDHVSMIFEAS